MPTPTAQLSANEALDRLVRGNRRYVESQLQHPDQSSERREQLRMGQHPFAVVLGCADSRVPPEVIFDEGLGDLFVVRIAGNVVGSTVLASLEGLSGHVEPLQRYM